MGAGAAVLINRRPSLKRTSQAKSRVLSSSLGSLPSLACNQCPRCCAPDQCYVTMSQKIQVTFELKPPRAADSAETIPSHQAYAFPLATASKGVLRSSEFYESLRFAILSAKERTGADLTKYRDLVGDAEKTKGLAIKPTSDDEEEDTEE